MIKELYPNSKIPKASQYKIAWDALTNQLESAERRSHAKCWITYRAIDGEIQPKDWLESVSDVYCGDIATPAMKTRWDTSIITARIYWMILNGIAWHKEAEFWLGQHARSSIESYKSTATNLVRLAALVAYKMHLDADPSRDAFINDSIAIWSSQWKSFDPKAEPYRVVEMRNDCAPLYVMSRMMNADKHFATWADEMVLVEKGTPWGKCLLEISRDERSLWPPRDVELVKNYTLLHSFSAYGQGSVTPELAKWTRQQFRRLATPNARLSAIDFGCGQSRNEIKKIWPDAEVTHYDPAIKGIDEIKPNERYGFGICTDVFEHIPEDDVRATLITLAMLADNWMVTIHTGQAKTTLPDGSNAHCTQRDMGWWIEMMSKEFMISSTLNIDGNRFAAALEKL